MNRIPLFIILSFLSLISFAQITLGIKAGANLNFSKEAIVPGLSNFDFIGNSDNASFGFVVGIMSEVNIRNSNFFFRPEILFSKINYDFPRLLSMEGDRFS